MAQKFLELRLPSATSVDVPITISCGIAEFRTGDSIEAVFKPADQALYRAKDEGRKRCVLAGA